MRILGSGVSRKLLQFCARNNTRFSCKSLLCSIAQHCTTDMMPFTLSCATPTGTRLRSETALSMRLYPLPKVVEVTPRLARRGPHLSHSPVARTNVTSVCERHAQPSNLKHTCCSWGGGGYAMSVAGREHLVQLNCVSKSAKRCARSAPRSDRSIPAFHGMSDVSCAVLSRAHRNWLSRGYNCRFKRTWPSSMYGSTPSQRAPASPRQAAAVSRDHLSGP